MTENSDTPSLLPIDGFAGLEPLKPLAPEVRRKQLAFRSRYRGIKEMDIIMGQFCAAVLPDLSEEELSQFEALLRESDHDLYSWISGRSEVPEQAKKNPMIVRLLEFDFKPVDR